MHKLVIARYNEELHWIHNVPRNFDIILYNKGDDITDSSIIERCAQIIKRPNEGRESETYATHMLSHDINDENFTVFAQGGVLEHSPDFISALHQIERWKPVQPLSWCWRTDKGVPPEIHLNATQKKLNGAPRLRPEHFSLSLWGPLDFEDRGATGLGTVYRIVNRMPDGANIAAHMLERLKLYEVAKKAEAHKVGTFAYGAIFAVQNSLISNLPKDVYQALRNVTLEPVAANGYILERLWLHMFGYDFELAR